MSSSTSPLQDYERLVIQKLIQLHDVIRRNKIRNCAKMSNACNYEDPTRYFEEATQSLRNLLLYTETSFHRTNLYIEMLTQYNDLVTYAMHPSEPVPDIPIASSTILPTPTPIHTFLVADTPKEKINVLKSTLFGYN